MRRLSTIVVFLVMLGAFPSAAFAYLVEIAVEPSSQSVLPGQNASYTVRMRASRLASESDDNVRGVQLDVPSLFNDGSTAVTYATWSGDGADGFAEPSSFKSLYNLIPDESLTDDLELGYGNFSSGGVPIDQVQANAPWVDVGEFRITAPAALGTYNWDWDSSPGLQFRNNANNLLPYSVDQPALQLTVVPEPGTVLLGLCSLLSMLCVRWRRHSC